MATEDLILDNDILELSPDFDLLKSRPVQFKYYCGVDIGSSGKGRDKTCISVIQEKRTDFKDVQSTQYTLLDLVRFDKKIDYIQQAHEIARYFQQPYFQNNETRINCDASGIGAGTVSFLKKEYPGLKIKPVQIVGGETKKHDRVSRNYLFNMLSEFFQLHLNDFRISADLKHAAELRRQIESIEPKQTASGNLIYSVSGRDDELLSLMLACLEISERSKVTTTVTDYFLGGTPFNSFRKRNGLS